MSNIREGVRGDPRAKVVWWFRGRRSQHEIQARGLIKALEACCPLRVYAAPVMGTWKAWRSILRRHYPAADLPDPDILIGAGSETHLSMLAARRVRGGHIVTLSTSVWPRWCFDLYILSARGGGKGSKRVILTRGLLPLTGALSPKTAGTGLMVIGGATSQYRWSDDEIMAQIGEIISRQADYRWYLTTTDVTSPETEQRLQAMTGAKVFCIPRHEVDAKWLSGRIQDAEQVWFSEDNVAMIYQALTAGAAVGVLPVPRRRASKALSKEIAALEGLVVFFPQWREGRELQAPQPPFNESARCATEIYTRWLNSAV